MANLDAYIDFSVELDKSISTPVIRLTDPDNYPAPIPLYMEGVFSITQPDGITVTGTFTSPDIYWDGSGLVVAEKELRLATDGNFQQGLYVFTYMVHCVGFDDTVLTKTYNLSYTPVTLDITDLMDVFTPSLQQMDSTIYAQNGFTSSVTRAWEGVIYYAGTSIGNVSGNTIVFDLKYSGIYWDAKYIITLTSTIEYVAEDSDDWVSLIDVLTTNYQVDAYAPPTIQSLLSQLNTMKLEVDAGTYCGGHGCGCGCSDEQAFLNAQADYDLLKSSGCSGNTIGIYYLIPQMIKLFTCNGTYTPTHTNAPITAYNFGCGSTGGLSLLPYSESMIINSADFPSGATSVTLNLRSYGTKNTDVYVELQNQPVTPLLPQTVGDFTYAVIFGLAVTTITFQLNGVPTAPNDDQIMIIRGVKYA